MIEKTSLLIVLRHAGKPKRLERNLHGDRKYSFCLQSYILEHSFHLRGADVGRNSTVRQN